jgi:hypothetical protein
VFPSGLQSRVRSSVFCSASWPRRFFVDDEKAMSATLIVFILIILLFGFDSTGQVKTTTESRLGKTGGGERFAQEI